MKHTKHYITFFALIQTFNLSGQPPLKSFGQLSWPEKMWVISHPFVAKKALKISTEAVTTAKKIQGDTLLYGDGKDGQTDAFRHAYWMARLSQEIHVRKARKLGQAHEKGNKKDFKKGRKEEGEVPDSVSIQMDLYNNKKGLGIGKAFPDTSREAMVSIVIKAIIRGEMKVVKQDCQGNYLTASGMIIPENAWKNKWINPRILVSSGTPCREEE